MEAIGFTAGTMSLSQSVVINFLAFLIDLILPTSIKNKTQASLFQYLNDKIKFWYFFYNNINFVT